MTALRLHGKTAVITGAAGNLGTAAARRFLDEGASVLLVDRDAAALDRVRVGLGSPKANSFVADVTATADVRACAAHAASLFGKVDVFYNNAGIEGPSRPIAEFPEEAFDRVMAVNVRGVFLGMKYLPPVMRDGGSIIISSSIAGLKGSGGFVAYTASKHAVVGIMRDTAIDLAPRGLRVNTIHPGFVDSDMVRRILQDRTPGGDDREMMNKLGTFTKFGRCIQPAEIAAMVCWLASDESRMATGQTFVIDAGTLL
jgi:NAD(P)-dependent dehydrogenase (short-subunit alcohol dehydrogenase family)